MQNLETKKIISYIQQSPRILKKLGFEYTIIYPFIDIEKNCLIENHALYLVKKENQNWLFEKIDNNVELVNVERLNEIKEEVYKKRRHINNYKNLFQSLTDIEYYCYSNTTTTNQEFLKNAQALSQSLKIAKTYPKDEFNLNKDSELLIKWLREGNLEQIFSVELSNVFMKEKFQVMKKNNEIKIIVYQHSYSKNLALFEIPLDTFSQFIHSYEKEDKEKLTHLKALLEKYILESQLDNNLKAFKFKKI
jgi:hypothetical protein